MPTLTYRRLHSLDRVKFSLHAIRRRWCVSPAIYVQGVSTNFGQVFFFFKFHAPWSKGWKKIEQASIGELLRRFWTSAKACDFSLVGILKIKQCLLITQRGRLTVNLA